MGSGCAGSTGCGRRALEEMAGLPKSFWLLALWKLLKALGATGQSLECCSWV